MSWIWAIAGAFAAGIAAMGGYVFRNLTYDRAPVEALPRRGFTEKDVVLPDGTVLHYGEGPEAGPPLLLLHGQGVTWQDYAKVLPLLAKKFHVYAVDCHGHGKSTFQSEKYSARAMGGDFTWFLEYVVGQPAYVSGHSSGGLLAVWLAANAPDWVRGIVVEDAPLFSTEVGEKEHTFAYLNSFCKIHDFLHQTGETDYLTYMLAHSQFRDLVGQGWDKMMETLSRYRARHPDRKPKVWWMPPGVNAIWVSISDPYDPWFGESFYDQSWFEGFDQAMALQAITCPVIFLKAATRWRDGTLMAALSEEDCQRVCSLLRKGKRIDFPKAGHDLHADHPRAFAAALTQILEEQAAVESQKGTERC